MVAVDPRRSAGRFGTGVRFVEIALRVGSASARGGASGMCGGFIAGRVARCQ